MDEVQAQYVVRTPVAFTLAVGLMWALAVIAAGAALMLRDTWTMLFAIGMAIGAVAFMRQAAYQIGGIRGLVRFHADRLEVPAAAGRTPLVFARGALAVEVREMRGTVVVGVVPLPVHRSQLVTLHGGGRVRQLSTVVLADRDDASVLVADLRRFLAGERALGRHVPPAAPRTELDDQLDRELAALE